MNKVYKITAYKNGVEVNSIETNSITVVANTKRLNDYFNRTSVIFQNHFGGVRQITFSNGKIVEVKQ